MEDRKLRGRGVNQLSPIKTRAVINRHPRSGDVPQFHATAKNVSSLRVYQLRLLGASSAANAKQKAIPTEPKTTSDNLREKTQLLHEKTSHTTELSDVRETGWVYGVRMTG